MRKSLWHPECRPPPNMAPTGTGSELVAGEDPAAFERLHRDLVAEFSPTGALEEDIVWTMARILWRKDHMEIVRAAQRAWGRYNRIEI